MNNKKKIMIVDDEVDFLSIIKLNLEGTDKYIVKILAKSIDIVSEANNFKPDLIVMDLLMPGLDGIEACKLLKSDRLACKIPIIVLSALEKKEDKRMAYASGAIDYLVKPIEASKLIERIDIFIKEKRA